MISLQYMGICTTCAPNPRPPKVLPTIRISLTWAKATSMLPIIMLAVPSKIDFFRPIASVVNPARIAPRIEPKNNRLAVKETHNGKVKCHVWVLHVGYITLALLFIGYH